MEERIVDKKSKDKREERAVYKKTLYSFTACI